MTNKARHVFEPISFHNVIGTAEPVLTIADGDTVITTAIDAWGFDRHSKQVASAPNPMTGPFFVRGAEPGDTLTVHIDSMTPNRDTGWTLTPLAPNVIDPAAVAKMPDGRIAMATGFPVMHLVLFDPVKRSFEDLGPVEARHPICYFHGMAVTADGVVYLGETDSQRCIIYRCELP